MSKENDKEQVATSINVDEEAKNNEVDNGSTEKSKTEETTKVDETVKTDETEKSADEPKKDGEEAQKVDEKAEVEETVAEKPQVAETEPAGNGISVNDLVTKDELSERLSSLEAKFDAVLKENGDLKTKLSEMEEKYENKDFGNFQRKGVIEKDKDANSSFDEYSKQFMS